MAAIISDHITMNAASERPIVPGAEPMPAPRGTPPRGPREEGRRRGRGPQPADGDARHADQAKGAAKPLSPARPKLTPIADTVAVTVGARVAVVWAGWNRLVSRTGSGNSPAVNSATSMSTNSPMRTR